MTSLLITTDFWRGLGKTCGDFKILGVRVVSCAAIDNRNCEAQMLVYYYEYTMARDDLKDVCNNNKSSYRLMKCLQWSKPGVDNVHTFYMANSYILHGSLIILQEHR